MLALPKREIVDEPLDFRDRAIEPPYEQIAAMADPSSTQIRAMVVVLIQQAIGAAYLTSSGMGYFGISELIRT